MLTVLIMIGNSDDKLAQHQWCSYWTAVHNLVLEYADEVHGEWVSESMSPFQNAAWCAVFYEDMAAELKGRLRVIAHTYEQDSIAWAEIPEAQFLIPLPPSVRS